MKIHPLYSAVSNLIGYPDLFNAAETTIEEKFGAYSQGMRECSKARNSLINDCADKFRVAEIQAEKDSIKVFEKYNSKWKNMIIKIDEKFSTPNKNEVEIDQEENEIKEAIEIVKCDLLDIELKM
jgi:hypothetical protein